jgi:hypothetical protein
MKATNTNTTVEAAEPDRLLDEKDVLTIHPVSGPTLKRQRKHPNPALRFPPPDLKFFDNGKNFWFESTVRGYHRRVAEYLRQVRESETAP